MLQYMEYKVLTFKFVKSLLNVSLIGNQETVYAFHEILLSKWCLMNDEFNEAKYSQSIIVIKGFL
jgi:hypothetical protein